MENGIECLLKNVLLNRTTFSAGSTVSAFIAGKGHSVYCNICNIYIVNGKFARSNKCNIIGME